MKNRGQSLNLIKVIAIFCVCLYHGYLGDSNVFALPLPIKTIFYRFLCSIESCCVPLFFMVNGALLLNKSSFSLSAHTTKILHITLQFWCWGLITNILIGITSNIPLRCITSKSFISTILFNTASPLAFTPHFWFVFTLIGIYDSLRSVRKIRSFVWRNINDVILFSYWGSSI